jgi:SpoVK/Ycf46/Vps4 family AAA+-type ATPase
LPEALCREGRFDSIVEFKLPDPELRKKILLAHLKHQGVRILDRYVEDIVGWSGSLSGAALRELALQISVRGYDEEFVKKHIKHREELQGQREEDGDKNEPEKAYTNKRSR